MPGDRILCVGPTYPWPAVDGHRLRWSNLIRALADAGPVDVVSFRGSDDPEPKAPPIDSVSSISLVGDEPKSNREVLGPWLRSDLTRQSLLDRYHTAAGELRRLEGHPFGLVMVSHLDTWIQLAHVLPSAPLIIDYENLQDRLFRSRRRQLDWRTGSRPERVRRVAKWARSVPVDAVDARRWGQWQRRAAAVAVAVTVCSEVDVRVSGISNAVSIPNGYELEWSAPSRVRSVGDPPTILFVGLLSYEPNSGGVRWFVEQVLPVLRRRIPSVRLRIVGRDAHHVDDLRGRPGVDVVGAVESMRSELDRADLAVVPIRFGGGTRLKVTEALANRVPCVTTSIGCEGIDVVDGQHVLIADDAAGFAQACGRLLTDVQLRSSLTDAGVDLFERCYRWSTIRSKMTGLAQSAMSS